MGVKTFLFTISAFVTTVPNSTGAGKPSTVGNQVMSVTIQPACIAGHARLMQRCKLLANIQNFILAGDSSLQTRVPFYIPQILLKRTVI